MENVLHLFLLVTPKISLTGTARSSIFCSKVKFTSEIWHRFLNRFFTAPMFRFLDKVARASHILQRLSCVVLHPYYWFCHFYCLYSHQPLLSTNKGAQIVTVMVNIWLFVHRKQLLSLLEL